MSGTTMLRRLKDFKKFILFLSDNMYTTITYYHTITYFATYYTTNIMLSGLGGIPRRSR